MVETVRRLVVPSLQTVKVLRHDSVRELLQLVSLVRRFFGLVCFFPFLGLVELLEITK